MVEMNSNFWNEHLLFRNYLRNNSEARIQYSELKKELALKYENDREKYTSSKSDAISLLSIVVVSVSSWDLSSPQEINTLENKNVDAISK